MTRTSTSPHFDLVAAARADEWLRRFRLAQQQIRRSKDDQAHVFFAGVCSRMIFGPDRRRR